LEHCGVVRVYTTKCPKKLPLYSFACHDFDVIKGSKWFKGGRLCFPEPPPGAVDETFYATYYGMNVVHSGSVYGRCDFNVSLALTRLTARRVWGGPGHRPYYHEELRDNQRTFLAAHSSFFEELGWTYSNHQSLQDFESGSEECRLHHADPHPKRALRIIGFNGLVDTGKLEDFGSNWVRGLIEAKMKGGEIAKPDSIPRMIFDLGVEASLLGFRITEALKDAMRDLPIYVNGGVIQFIKTPNPFVLERVFDQLICPDGRFYFAYFSDDSCLTIRLTDGRLLRYNLDISSCDSSHTKFLFATFLRLFPERSRTEVLRLVSQCSQAFQVKSVHHKGLSVVLRPREPKLYSGSTLTTVVNNLACISLALSLSEIPSSDWGTEAMVSACERAGYKVTGCTPLEHIEDLQFLKNSPVLDSQKKYRPLLNLGAFLRASGRVKGDLPGRGDIRNRAYRFQKGLMQGAYPHASIPFLSELYKRLPGDGFPVDYFSTKVETDVDYPTWEVDQESLFLRYRLLSSEVDDLHYWARHADFGLQLHCSAFNKILKIDYNLSACPVDEREYLVPLL